MQWYLSKDTNGNVLQVFNVPDLGPITLVPVAATDPAVVAFLATPASDATNSDNLNKQLKAILISAAVLAGKTPAQAKATFVAVWNQLP